MIVGIGTDLVEIRRIESILDRRRERFVDRIYTSAECVYCDKKASSFQEYAARFAAKEAVMKALGTGRSRGVAWRDIEVVNEPSGRPTIRMTGRAAERARAIGAQHCHLTLSHDGGFAIATVVFEGEPQGESRTAIT